jgi:hypothetical protein
MNRQKIKTRLSLATVLLLPLIPVSAVSAQHVPMAAKQSLRVLEISDHCVDEFSEEDTVYITEGNPDCKISIQVRGRGKTKSKVALEYYDYDEGWIRTEYKVLTTNASGKVTFVLDTEFPNQPGDECYADDSWTHRFAVSRTGKYKAFRSATFEVTYSSSDTNPACSDYEE